MTVRKCIFTDDDSKAKTRIIPKEDAGDEIDNWCNSAPISKTYQELVKQQNLPTELEMRLNETFHLLELAKLRVVYYEAKLKKLQKELVEAKVLEDKLKLEDFKKMEHIKDLAEEMEAKMKADFEQKSKLWKE
jgi:hypothetical protein